MLTIEGLLASFIGAGGTWGQGLGPKTIEQYEICIRSLDGWVHSQLFELREAGITTSSPLLAEHLTPELVNAYLAWFEATPTRRGRPPSRETCKNRLVMIRTLWSWGHDQDLIELPPRKLKRYRVPKKQVVTWSPEHAAAFLAACEDEKGWFPKTGIKRADWWASLVKTAWHVGCRKGDLVWFKADKRGVLFRQIRGGVLRRKQNKTGRPLVKRLPRDVLESIERIRRPKRKPIYPWLDNPRLFNSHVQAICERAGIPFGSFGDLRKGSATEVYRKRGYEAAQKHLQHAPGSSATRNYIETDGLDVPAPDPLD